MNDERGTLNDIERRDLRKRTKLFALRIIKLYASLPKSTAAQILGKQIVRSGTSVGAHYREAKRARSTAEFVSKVEVAYRNLMRRFIGLNFCVKARSLPYPASAAFKMKRNN